MKHWRNVRAAIALTLAGTIACPPARALVTFNDSHDHVFINASVTAGRDSNVFANSDNTGDVLFSTGISAEYTRRAGWIGVNASVAINATRYGKLAAENFSNPSYSMELTKQTGRTTGTFTLSGARESRADSAVNIRSQSWNYQAGLNYKYPIVERYTLSGGFAYSARKYVDPQTQLVNLSTYSANVDLFYVLSNERDLVAGYRYRKSESSADTYAIDNDVNLGVSGRIIRGVNGSIRVGYQVRTPHGPGESPEYSAWTASASSRYDINKRLSVSGSVSKDFSTTATDTSVDSTNASLDATWVKNTHWSVSAGVSAGDSRFLGEKGRVVVTAGPPAVLGANRHDTFFSWNAGLNYSMNEHFKANLTYSWFENWSTLHFADFVRNNWSAGVSSRW